MKRLLLGLALLSLTSLGFAQKKANYASVPSLVKEAKEKGNIKFADSLAQGYINDYLFKLKKEELYTKENLNFMSDFLGNERSKAFKLFTKESGKINVVLGDYKAQTKVMDFINQKYLPQGDFKTIDKPDWDALEKVVVGKFGQLGQEVIYAQRMIYYLTNKDWKNYGIWYQKYTEIGFKHAVYNLNNLSWYLFDHIEDQKVLSFACDVVMKYAIEKWHQNDSMAWDTYANLLYKTGKKDQAIEWEEKAIKLAKGNEYLEKQFTTVLEKMRRNERTWKEPISNP